MKSKGSETKQWLIAGAGIALIGYFYNKFKTPAPLSISAGSNSLTSQVGSLLTSYSTGNTGIAGQIASIAGGVLASLPAKTATATTTTQQQLPAAVVPVNNTPVTTSTLINVVDQFNSIISDIVNPTAASAAKVANADPNTKFNEALKWAKTAKIVLGKSQNVTPTQVLLTIDGQLRFFNLDGSAGASPGADTVLLRSQYTKNGWVIF